MYWRSSTILHFSLFGRTLNADSDISEIYNRIDKLIFYYMTHASDENLSMFKVDLYVPTLCRGANGFTYSGTTFSSIRGNPSGDGTIYNACSSENSKSYISALPLKEVSNPSYHRDFTGYWLKAANGIGSREGFCTVQVKFDYQNAKSFINSCNNIFQ